MDIVLGHKIPAPFDGQAFFNMSIIFLTFTFIILSFSLATISRTGLKKLFSILLIVNVIFIPGLWFFMHSNPMFLEESDYGFSYTSDKALQSEIFSHGYLAAQSDMSNAFSNYTYGTNDKNYPTIKFYAVDKNSKLVNCSVKIPPSLVNGNLIGVLSCER